LIKALDAVSQFRAGEFDRALDLFVELNINPTNVISLYPETISGRLSVPREQWIQMFGGPEPKPAQEATSSSSSSSSEHGGDIEEPGPSGQALAPAGGGLVSKLKNPLDAIRPSGPKDPETVSIGSKKDKPRIGSYCSPDIFTLNRDNNFSVDDFSRSVESLLRYLPDRRQKLLGALEAFHITPAQSHRHVALSDMSSDSLRGIPDAPFSSLTPEQLVQCAQVVDTALFKSYLVVRPGLLGPLCRRDNWCEVAEVEETLAAREVRPICLVCLHDLIFLAFLGRNSRNSLIYTMSGRCTLKPWSSSASEHLGLSTSDLD
jgi:Vam6/Vps39-like protein vacuolar protein sorting-associated protein 39